MSAPASALWINGRPLTDAGGPDPRGALVARGEGLIETMRAQGGHIAWLEAHLDRLEASGRALRLDGLPGRDRLEAWIARALEGAAEAPLRVRLTAAPGGLALVEVGPAEVRPAPEPGLRAIALPGAWLPTNRLAEHKTLALEHGRWARRRARAAGVDCALLLDGRDRAGEADLANLLVVRDGRISTAPARGLLAGLTRAWLRRRVEVAVALPDPGAHREADELLLTSAVAGVVPVVELDGHPVGEGRPGPVGRRLAALLARRGHERP